MIRARLPASCDIFCRVVDNFGDIGVAWRLARQLHEEYEIPVRLVVDDLSSFRLLAPALVESCREQTVDDIAVVAWVPQLKIAATADLVIEAFGCELPPDYVASMARRPVPPVWLNLEYLSAEAWVDTHHLLPSPHTVYPLTKYFFFPGFTSKSGGLIRERRMRLPPQSPGPPSVDLPLQMLVFAYANCPAEALLLAIGENGRQVRLRVPEGKLADRLKHWCALQGQNARKAATVLDFSVIPFVPQIEFDGLLGQFDMFVVRGEDSLVRALWAAKPFVWHIYPQAQNAHWTKLNAFLDSYCEGLSLAAEASLREIWRAWNAADSDAIAPAWDSFLGHLHELRGHAVQWSARQAKQPDLVSNLLSFYQKTAKI